MRSNVKQQTADSTEKHLCDVRGDDNFPFRGLWKDGTLLVARQVGVQWENLGL